MAQSSNNSTVARPYAQAVFQVARESKRLEDWGQLLDSLAALLADERAAAVIRHPAIPPADLAEALIETLGERSEEERNFLRLLAERRRLTAAASMAEQYRALRDEEEGRMTVQVHTAHTLDKKASEALQKKLGERLGRKIELEVVEDDSLLGGVLLRAGDLVIDGSVKGQLDRLAAAMSH